MEHNSIAQASQVKALLKRVRSFVAHERKSNMTFKATVVSKEIAGRTDHKTEAADRIFPKTAQSLPRGSEGRFLSGG